ncbi:MAG: hypothetical protein Q8865_09610, partial [Bacillota bacterium]|nr:hypothetical protein [Bacillota bacterium]
RMIFLANKPEETKTVFTKNQLLSSKRYENCRDILSAQLKGGSYSLDETDEIINKFLKGKVK